MLLANTEFDTSQDVVNIPGSWPAEDSNTHSRNNHTSSEPYRPRRRPHRGRYQPRNKAYRLSRDELREMALVTLGSLDDGFYIYHSHGMDVKVDLKDAIEWVSKETSYFGPDWDGEADGERVTPEDETGGGAVEAQEDEGNENDRNSFTEMDSDVAEHATNTAATAEDEVTAVNETGDESTAIALQGDCTLDESPTQKSEKIILETDRQAPADVKTRIVVAEYSTLVGTRKLHHLIQDDESVKNKTIGVLNFASAKKPGGGFLNGAQAQEESLARVSTLYPSLLTPTAQRFYGHWQADSDNAFYTHSAVYSPSVVFFRNDKGDWKAPMVADILTCAAVNAGEIRDRIKWGHEQREMELRANEVAQDMWRLAEKRKAEEQLMRKDEMKRLRDVRAEMEGAADQLDRSLKTLQEESEKRASDEHRVGDEGMEVDEEETQRAVEIGEQISTVESHREEVQEKLAEIDREIAQLAEELNDTHVETPNVAGNMEKQLMQDNEDQNSNLASDLSEHTLNNTQVAGKTVTEGPSTADGDMSDQLSEADNPFASPEDQHGLPPVTEPMDLQLPGSPTTGMTLEEAEESITSEMKERIFRILKIFQKQGAQHLVLGSFGTGVFQNEVDIVAGIFRELLVGPADNEDKGPEAPFRNVFSNVVFAILGGGTVRVFENVFDGVAEKDDEVHGGSGSEDEPMGGGEEVPQHTFFHQDAAATSVQEGEPQPLEVPDESAPSVVIVPSS